MKWTQIFKWIKFKTRKTSKAHIKKYSLIAEMDYWESRLKSK